MNAVKEQLKATAVRAKEWRKPHTPHVARSTKTPTCPLTPVLFTDKRANAKRTAVPPGYSTPVQQQVL